MLKQQNINRRQTPLYSRLPYAYARGTSIAMLSIQSKNYLTSSYPLQILFLSLSSIVAYFLLRLLIQRLNIYYRAILVSMNVLSSSSAS
jgi:hypothetical protein